MVSDVFLSLNGVTIGNNSYVRFSEIDSDGILCNTDRLHCCRSVDNPDRVVQGHWYNPGEVEVGRYDDEHYANDGSNFFARNRDTGVVRLFPTGIPTERGRFRCEIPNADGDIVSLYVNIVDGELPSTFF